MSQPTQMQLFRATVEHRPHEQFLYYTRYTDPLAHKLVKALGLKSVDDIAERYGLFTPVSVGMLPPDDCVAPDFTSYFEGMDVPENATINWFGMMEIPGSMYHFTRYVSPLRNATSLDEIKSFPYPTPAGWTDSHMAAQVREAHEKGLVVTSWVGHMYEDSWQIRGYEEFLMDMHTNPDICEYVLDRISERNLVYAVAAAKAGVDYLTTGDDVANQRALMFTPKMWRHFMKPRWARVYKAARAVNPNIEIWYHSDGDIRDIIPELIEIGVTILNPVQPECMDIHQLKREYGKDLVFDGTVGTQTTMPFGTPDEVRAVVRDRKSRLGQDGALVLSPTHVLEPEVPVENIVAFYEAAAD
jgi:uroporphyrinogen decarboxylase